MTEPHPHYTALYEHAKTKPDAVEDHPWGEVVFKVRGKIFIFLGMGDKAAMTVKAEKEELEALLAMPNVEKAPYVGRYGWVSVRVDEAEQLELALELIDTSYELIRGKRK
jgi:predicted DNA-binding protein (MmcQ/YjbR family)